MVYGAKYHGVIFFPLISVIHKITSFSLKEYCKITGNSFILLAEVREKVTEGSCKKLWQPNLCCSRGKEINPPRLLRTAGGGLACVCPGWALWRVLPAQLRVPAGQGMGRNPARPAATHRPAELRQDAARVLQLVMLALSCSSQAPWGSREPWQIHVLFLQVGIVNLGWLEPKGAGILCWAEEMEMTMSNPDETNPLWLLSAARLSPPRGEAACPPAA